MDQFIGPSASCLNSNSKSKSKMITDFFGKKRGRKRKVSSELSKNKSLYRSSRNTKSIFSQDGGDVYAPIIVKARKNVDDEWSCISEDIVITLSDNSTDNDSLSLSSGDVDIVEPPANNEPNVIVGSDVAQTTFLSRKNCIRWHLPQYFPILVEAITNRRKPVKLWSLKAHGSGMIVPPTTLNSVMRRLGNKKITVENCFKDKKQGLLSNELVEVLQDIIRKRDQINNGVTRKEAIQLIVDLGQCVSSKAAENHLDYLIRLKRLPDLKRNGRIILAQSTTTERSQINREQQLRWHFLIESEWEFMRTNNIPKPLFASVHEHFQLNLDESCFMCNDGI